MIFHIDGNSFYAACERLFRPDLYKSPIAVLSNNDGIIVALNAECKALGYKRGDVFFQVKRTMIQQGVQVFSSNYTLYADMSARMNLIYNRFTDEVETYSIDESFLYFPTWTNTDYILIANKLKNTVTKETGIPVSIGIAPNKTLAKLCNKLAKKREGVGTTPGICSWQELNQDEELANYPAGDIWGIGYAKAALLKKQGIITALDLKHYPLHKAKKHMTITGMKTVQELNGIAAIDKIETDFAKGAAHRQVIMVSRSFQGPVFELNDIMTALAEYTQEAVKRMRADRLSCRCVSVYLMTNAFSKGGQYANQLIAELPHPSAYLPEIQAAANELLKRIYRPNYKYRKVMIGLIGLVDGAPSQLDLFNDQHSLNEQHESVMQVFDTINNRYGRGAIKLACSLASSTLSPNPPLLPWKLRRDHLSPRYTTNIKEIPIVY